ncbi:hypothetical protein [Halotia branconii]|uniref:Uncharacterized protein n=1 Tax=Halotia branconii CENA392 TaxID=1539056 RepID=A0AAJ6PC45_9CYAN|nr:hypothetical protein [Halotia branconii]WGV28396.1 hypothetical protein QI031_13390 [Halotia branconii CENA392]
MVVTVMLIEMVSGNDYPKSLDAIIYNNFLSFIALGTAGFASQEAELP